MKNPPKKECPYWPNRCTISIRTEDKSCYDICNVYKDWDKLIDEYKDQFDYEVLNIEEVLQEMETKSTIIERFDLWLKKYHNPFYDKFDIKTKLGLFNRGVRKYQDFLKHRNRYSTYLGDLMIPKPIYFKYFEEGLNDVEFTYHKFIKHETKTIFELSLYSNKWDEKLKSPLSKTFIEGKLRELQEFEDRTKHLLANNEIKHLYSDYKMQYYNSEYKKYSKEIEFLRFEIDYYKNNLISNSTTLKILYADHFYLKPYLKKALNEIHSITQELNSIDEIKNSQSYKGFQRQINQDGYCLIAETKVYTPLLAHTLTKELEVKVRIKYKKPVIKKIRGLDYIPSYQNGYQEGIEYFRNNFSISPSLLYTDKGKDYIDDLHQNYCHIVHYLLYAGWQFVKTAYPITVNHKIIKEFGYYAGIVSEVDSLREKYPKVFANFDSCPLADVQEKKTTLTKLPLKIIALKHVYERIQITRQNGNSIAQTYGHKSGDKLFQEYTFYASSANRKGKPTPCTKVKLQNKINRLETVIELLPLDKQSTAKDEVAILRSHFDNEFG